MKFILLNIIRLYWILFPKEKRRKCIFHKSCSTYVYEMTRQNGFKSGILALNYRIRVCRPEFDVFTDLKTGKKKMLLRTGQFVEEDQIASRLK